MKKIRLNMEKLEIASFETGEDRAARGTVQGHNRVTADGSWTCFYHCTWNHNTCDGEASCGCNATAECVLTQQVSCAC